MREEELARLWAPVAAAENRVHMRLWGGGLSPSEQRIRDRVAAEKAEAAAMRRRLRSAREADKELIRRLRREKAARAPAKRQAEQDALMMGLVLPDPQTTSHLAARAGVSITMAANILRRLHEQGRVARKNADQGILWRLTSTPP